jgi:uncharacterized caspase-like protein
MAVARFLLAITLSVAVFAASAEAETRVALVIGNGAYAHAPKLLNPPNDAADIAVVLRGLGFQVVEATDVNKSAFDLKLREFARALHDAQTALFFYAGHGMQVAGKNYAVPTDARLENAADLQVETVDIDQVLSIMQASDSRVSLVFIDACRDNPLAQNFARSLPATRSTSVGRGLSPVEAGHGALIAFATAPNRIAFDGNGQRNSPFTAALLKHIRTPGLDIGLIMRRVTADVESASSGAQVPWMHASLTTDVVLTPSSDGGLNVAPRLPSSPAPPPSDEIAWSLIKDTKDAGQLRRFIQKFPGSAHRTEAEAGVAALEAPPVVEPVPEPSFPPQRQPIPSTKNPTRAKARVESPQVVKQAPGTDCFLFNGERHCN